MRVLRRSLESGLTPLIRVDQELVGFNLPVPQGPVEGLQHQRRLHGRAHGPADHTAAVQVDPDGQIPPARCGADVSDVTGPGAVGRQGREVLLQQVLSDSSGPTAAVAAWPEPAPGLGLER